MPIIIPTTDIKDTNVSKLSYDNTPKFFNKDLTGNNKSTGILSEKINFKNINPNMKTNHIMLKVRRHTKIQNGSVQIRTIPLTPIFVEDINYLFKEIDKDMLKFDILSNNLTQIAKITKNKTDLNLYLSVMPQVIELEKNDETKGKKNDMGYMMFLILTDDINDDKKLKLSDNIVLSKNNTYFVKETTNPMLDIEDMIMKTYPSIYTNSFDADLKELDKYAEDYNTYLQISNLAEVFNTKFDILFNQCIDNAKNQIIKNNSKNVKIVKQNMHHFNELTILINKIKNLNDYKIPLDVYIKIYNKLETAFPNIINQLSKINLNLLMVKTLSELNDKKGMLKNIPDMPNDMKFKVPFSNEQMNAIKSTDPLVMIQSVAGSGKSSVILGRVDRLIASGIKPKDITVLSFTNAAADNIKAKNPNINSSTIASKIHDIYSYNFDTHQLSTLDTIVNSISIYYPNLNPTMVEYEFQKHCRELMKGDNESYIKMNAFIEDNYKQVISILDKIKQTSLELEIIICYQQIDKLKEKRGTKAKHLIIDETQDNSVFEFIYSLKYVAKNKASLFIVGKEQLPTLNPINCGELAI